MREKLKSKEKGLALRALYGMIIAFGILLFTAIGVCWNPFLIKAFAAENASDYIFLSDLDYLTGDEWSSNGWAGHDI